MYETNHIKNYIIHLKNDHGLSVTLHPKKPERVITSGELISFNIHDNSYCIFMKTCPQAQRHCIQKQKKVMEKLEQGSFCGTCYAGVKEYIYPIYDGTENVGFISVSGYKTENAGSYIGAVSEKYGLNREKLESVYGFLKDDMPKKEYTDTLIIPLCKMLELEYLKSGQLDISDESFPEKIIRYLKERHNQDITSKDICRHFSCSRSYMSTEFNRYTGKSIREYINELRVEDAKLLLVNSRLTVTEIALSVGFSDSNYFSWVFKNITGVSPLKYRKTSR